MTRFTFLALMSALLLGACRASQPEAIRYAIVAEEYWPVLVFVRDVSQPFAPYGNGPTARSSGWENRYGSIPLRPNGPVEEPVTFDLLWYEIVTEQAYAAQVSINPNDLELDPTSDEPFGTLILRVGGEGYLDAMTYENSFPPDPDPPAGTRLATLCGAPVTITDNSIEERLDWALGEPLMTEGLAFASELDELDATCRETR